MGAPEEISVPQESVVGSVLREILYLLLKIVAIAAAFVVVFTFVFGISTNLRIDLYELLLECG